MMFSSFFWGVLRIVCLVVGVTVLAPASAIASDPAAARAQDLGVIVVEGERPEAHPQPPRLASQSIQQDEARASSSLNVVPVLEQLPDGFVVRNEPFRLGAQTLRLQGADPNKVAVVIDGERVVSGIDGVVDLRDVPIELVERLDIVRGPVPTLYGTDAMAGAVRIRTIEPGATPFARAAVAGGNFSQLHARAAHGARRGSLFYALALDHHQVALAQQFGAVSAQFADRDAKQQRTTLFGKATWRYKPDQQLSTWVHYLPVREGPASERENLTTRVGWEGALPRGFFASAKMARYTFSRENTLRGFEENVAFEQWSGAVQVDRSFSVPFGVSPLEASGLLRWVASDIDLAPVSHVARGEVVLTTPALRERADQLSVAMELGQALGPAWSLSLGAGLDRHSRFDWAVSPRLQVAWQPTAWFEVHTVVGQGFRAPDLRELFDIDVNNVLLTNDRVTGYAIVGNPRLRPERDLAGSVSAKFGLLKGLQLDSSLFAHNFRDLIGVTLRCAGGGVCQPGFVNPLPRLQGQIFQYANVAEALTAGQDLTASVQLAPWLPAEFASPSLRPQLRVSYGFLFSENRSDRPGEGGRVLPFRPPHRLVLSTQVGSAHAPLMLRTWAEYVDRVYTDLGNTSSIASYWVWNTRGELDPTVVTKLWRPVSLRTPLGTRWRWFFEIRNVLDEEPRSDFPLGRVLGRRTFLSGVEGSFGS